MSPRYPATKQIREQVDNFLEQQDTQASPEQMSMLDSQIAEIDDWLDDAPDCVNPDKVSANVSAS